MNTNGQVLLSILNTALPSLRAISEANAGTKPAPDKWSGKETLGHLIDSAINNQVRFVTASSLDDLVFPGYDADEWVRLQDYQGREWTLIVDLWDNNNRHIAAVIDRLPEEVTLRKHRTHGLHEMAWQRVPANAPATLDYLIKDYIGHLEHHLRQILPAYEPVMIGTYEF